jgi:hypothetical protein
MTATPPTSGHSSYQQFLVHAVACQWTTRRFAQDGDVTQLLLFVDRAAERGVHSAVADIVSIVTGEMPDGTKEKEHLRQSLTRDGDQPAMDIAPALVVCRAVRHIAPRVRLCTTIGGDRDARRACALQPPG